LTQELREASRLTWSSGDPNGVDVAAIEYLDKRCLQIVREDGVDRQQSVMIPADAAMLLLIQLELARETSPAAAYDEIAQALSSAAANSGLTRFCQVLARHEVLGEARSRFQAISNGCGSFWLSARPRRLVSIAESAMPNAASTVASRRPPPT
jgi:D-lactate dehydrogenase (cytochrome)